MPPAASMELNARPVRSACKHSLLQCKIDRRLHGCKVKARLLDHLRLMHTGARGNPFTAWREAANIVRIPDRAVPVT